MAMDIFLKLDGIEGESEKKKHEKEIELLSWSWTGKQAGTFANNMGGSQGKVTFDDIVITKYVDKATPGIFKHLTTGKHIATGKIVIQKAGEDPIQYLVVDLEKVIVTDYSTGGSSDQADRLTESVALNFAQIKITYTAQTNTGVAGAASSAGYNIQTSSVVG